MSPIRVLLVDDHPVVRNGIRNFLESEPDIDVIGEAENGVQGIDMIRQLHPDIAILDMRLPDILGGEVIRRIREEDLQVQVLALSAYDDSSFIYEALRNGAAGYLLKEEVPSSIVKAVRGIASGEHGWFSRSVAANMSDQIQKQQTAEITNRELEVLKRVVMGMTNLQISTQMGISEKTVEKHLDSLFKKMNVSSRVEAAVLAVQLKMV
jgi:DNA-binding NarL/FixJ family response regulator